MCGSCGGAVFGDGLAGVDRIVRLTSLALDLRLLVERGIRPLAGAASAVPEVRRHLARLVQHLCARADAEDRMLLEGLTSAFDPAKQINTLPEKEMSHEYARRLRQRPERED